MSFSCCFRAMKCKEFVRLVILLLLFNSANVFKAPLKGSDNPGIVGCQSFPITVLVLRHRFWCIRLLASKHLFSYALCVTCAVFASMKNVILSHRKCYLVTWFGNQRRFVASQRTGCCIPWSNASPRTTAKALSRACSRRAKARTAGSRFSARAGPRARTTGPCSPRWWPAWPSPASRPAKWRSFWWCSPPGSCKWSSC